MKSNESIYGQGMPIGWYALAKVSPHVWPGECPGCGKGISLSDEFDVHCPECGARVAVRENPRDNFIATAIYD